MESINSEEKQQESVKFYKKRISYKNESENENVN
jgi:hypothetical protein